MYIYKRLPWTDETFNCPVDKSDQASPYNWLLLIFFGKLMASKKLLVLAFKNLSSVKVPGVILWEENEFNCIIYTYNLVISLLTSLPVLVLVVSSWQHRATWL